MLLPIILWMFVCVAFFCIQNFQCSENSHFCSMMFLWILRFPIKGWTCWSVHITSRLFLLLPDFVHYSPFSHWVFCCPLYIQTVDKTIVRQETVVVKLQPTFWIITALYQAVPKEQKQWKGNRINQRANFLVSFSITYSSYTGKSPIKSWISPPCVCRGKEFGQYRRFTDWLCAHSLFYHSTFAWVIGVYIYSLHYINLW